MFQELIKKYVSDNPTLVSMKKCGDDMFVLKYKRKVFYDALWNVVLVECRGTIVDSDFNIISYPFTKVFNYGVESDCPNVDDSYELKAFRKVNGFMVAITLHNDRLLVSTTGSVDSSYVDMAKEFIDEERYLKFMREHKDFTFMFECVHRNDPHIVPEVEGMYLLGFRSKLWRSQVTNTRIDEYAKELGCFCPESHTCTITELQEQVKAVKHEGFVAYTNEGAAIKIKSPYYLTCKWVARNPKIDKLLNDNIFKQIDEEYYPLIRAIRDNREEYSAMSEQERLAWVRNQLQGL